MTNAEIIQALTEFNRWRTGRGGEQPSGESITALLDAAVAALTLHPFPQEPEKETLPEPPVVAQKPKAKK